jgi:hypothetical protein
MEKDISDKIIAIANSLDVNPASEVKKNLIDLLNDLINKDFPALIQLLYRIDVNENKIRTSLNENKNEDTAAVLADLIIERQIQKSESRKTYRSKNNDISNEEKW